MAQKNSTHMSIFAHTDGVLVDIIAILKLIAPQTDQRTHSDSAPAQNPVLLALA